MFDFCVCDINETATWFLMSRPDNVRDEDLIQELIMNHTLKLCVLSTPEFFGNMEPAARRLVLKLV